MSLPHISVCICTCERPVLLERLLRSLATQQGRRLFTFSAVVADNDAAGSGRAVVESVVRDTGLSIQYTIEPRRNIALARNAAVAQASGDFIAFIDDDEFPVPGWLQKLHRTCETYQVAGVLGPVKPHFDQQPPAWVIKGGFYDRPTHPTGFVMSWPECRTGNVLLRRSVIYEISNLKSQFSNPAVASAISHLPSPTSRVGDCQLSTLNPQPVFNPAFGTGGEDQDFFRRMIERGHRFIWCDEAVAFEVVPPVRWSRRFMLSRALLRGKNSFRQGKHRARNLAKALVAVPLYCLALPVLLVAGHHHFMKYLVRLVDHVGRLLAWVGLNPASERRM